MIRRFPPSRIVCLTEETVETLYLLGEQDRIVGVSGYAVRPPQVRREKPRVSAFISADIPKILALEPDLVLTFSDLQATIAADLIRAGVAVHAFNQRDIAGKAINRRSQWPPHRRGGSGARERIAL
jgi:iron complex transport system substrate-binding protein